MRQSVALVLAVMLGLSQAYTGLDTIAAISVAGFQCLVSNGYHFYIARVGEETGGIDSGGLTNMKNAWSGGFSYVDAYIFPCHSSSCPSAKTQAQNTYNALKNNGVKFGQIWVDVEISNWPSSQSTNQQFISDMVSEIKALGVAPGVYTNNNNWSTIVGINWAGVKTASLWWANWSGQQNFNGFVAFGGWTKPNIRQYAGDVKGACSVGDVDLNWYP